MLGAIKKVCSLLVRLWAYLLRAIRSRPAQTPVQRSAEARSRNGGSWEEPGWETDGWEDFTVKVVPNESSDELPNPEEQDLFKDMVPVFKKTKTISVKRTGHSEEQAHTDKFAVQNSFQSDGGSLGELGVWSEEDANAWEDELVPEEGDLVQSSMASVKEKRRLERERRRAAQELMRSQQKTAASRQVQLGTRVS